MALDAILDVIHEINNPLNGIIGMAEVALEQGASTRKEFLTDILSCAQRINHIIREFKSCTHTSRSLVDVNEVLERSLSMVQKMVAPRSSVKVIKRLHHLRKIAVNVPEIQEVFTNLITNAFQAMNGKKGVLTLSTRLQKDWIEIKVSDNGVGISKENLSRIFERFFTTKNNGEGMGLGLNIVQRIVGAYGGTIGVESSKGLGTTFTVKFPVGGTNEAEKSIGCG